VGAQSRSAIDKRVIVRQTGRRVFSSLCRVFVATLAIAAFNFLAAAEDLKTTSGRVYKDAMILRADGRALMIQHRFGVVRVPFSEIAISSRHSFNAQKAGEIARTRQEERRHAAQKSSRPDADSARLERIDFQRASVELEEREEAIAEGMGEKIRHGKSVHHPTDRAAQHLRLKGEVIGVGPDWILVLCETDDTAVYARRELARLPNSPFAPPKPAVQEVVAVTALRQSFKEGESVDLVVEENGSRSDLRTRTGDSYSGRYRLFRSVN
jgi:hypothetical protein